jgi:hypothetical protein
MSSPDNWLVREPMGCRANGRSTAQLEFSSVDLDSEVADAHVERGEDAPNRSVVGQFGFDVGMV